MSHWCVLGSCRFVTQLLSVAPFAGLEVPLCVCVCVCVCARARVHAQSCVVIL